MNGRIWPLVFAMLATPTAACTNSNAAYEQALSQLRQKLHATNKRLSQTQVKLERLEGQVAQMETAKVRPSPKTPVASVSRRNQSGTYQPGKALPVVRLGRDARPKPQKRRWVDQGAIDDGSPPIVIKVGPSAGGERLSVNRSVLKRKDPVLSSAAKATTRATPPKPSKRYSKAEVRAAYEIALAKLRIENKPKKALALFQRFEARFVGTALADNVAYWSAECHLALGEHRAAIKRWRRLISEYPESAKVPDAWLRIGQTNMKLSQTSEARSAFSLVRDRYPQSEAGQKASAALDALSKGSQ